MANLGADRRIQTYDADTDTWVTRASGEQFIESLSSQMLLYSDFAEPPGFKAAEGIRAVLSGALSGVTVPTPPYDFTDHPGVWGLNTGTDTNGAVFLLSENLQMMHVGVGGITKMSWWIETEPNLSTALQRYILRFGWYSLSAGNTVNQGIGFEYTDNENGGRWQAICDDIIGETSVDTGVTVAANTWYYLEFTVSADGTEVEFEIDEVEVATITTNLPTGGAFYHFTNGSIFKVAGTTARVVYVDAYAIYQELSR